MKFASIDEYMAGVESETARASLEHLRGLIREVLPDAQEVISYQVPAFRRKKVIVYFAAFKNHCSLFVGTTTGDFLAELEGHKTSKGTIQFTPQSPLPDDLVRRIVLARAAALGARWQEMNLSNPTAPP